jgi:hypothetical protein
VLTVVPGAADADEPRRDGGTSVIDELVPEGARRMLAEALQAGSTTTSPGSPLNVTRTATG